MFADQVRRRGGAAVQALPHGGPRVHLRRVQARQAARSVCRSYCDTTADPPSKPVDTSLAEKFRTVEKTLSLVLSSVTAGVAPDPTALQQLQATLAEGLAAGGLTSSFPGGLEGSPDSSATSDHGRGGNHSNKRPRNEGASSMLGNRSGTHDSPAMSTSSNPMLSPMPPLARAPSNTSNTMPSPATSFTSGTGSTLGANSLSLLADASLAAEIDGRTQLTGLDPSFRLSSVTSALQGKTEGAEPVGHEKTPGLLSKGVVDAETAVELFRMFVSLDPRESR